MKFSHQILRGVKNGVIFDLLNNNNNNNNSKMKKSIIFRLAHSLFTNLKSVFTSFSAALKFAWQVVKSGTISFVKETGEVRTALIQEITFVDREKGFARFIEKTENGSQYRSFRFERVIVS